jgi:hypothetical protein
MIPAQVRVPSVAFQILTQVIQSQYLGHAIRARGLDQTIDRLFHENNPVGIIEPDDGSERLQASFNP